MALSIYDRHVTRTDAYNTIRDQNSKNATVLGLVCAKATILLDLTIIILVYAYMLKKKDPHKHSENYRWKVVTSAAAE